MKARCLLLAGATFCAAFAAQPGAAQVAANDPAQAPQADPAPSTDAVIADIVVTAQRRDESLQRTPLSIAAVSGAALAQGGVTQAQNLNGVVAGFQLGLAGSTAQPYVRGVGNADNTGFAVSGIAFNVDGVYVAQPVSYGSSLFDVQRLEVLRGPQGTLYGRNASGGAVNIITNRPTYDNGGYIGAEYGNYDQVRVNGALNLVAAPDKVAIRAAFQYGDRDGYNHDGTSDEDTLQGRLRVRLDPTEDVSVLLNAEYVREAGKGPGFALDTGASYNIPFAWEGAQGPNSAPFLAALDPTVPARQRQKSYNVSGELNWKLGDFTLTVLPAYRDVKVGLVSYNGFRYQVNENTWKEATAETRLSYDSDKLKAVAGLYYFHQKQSLDFFVDNFPVELAAMIPRLTTESYAAFGQATYSLTDALRVTGGLRYSHERQTLGPSQNVFFPPLGPPAGAAVPYRGEDASHSVDYRAALEVDLSPTSLAYVSAASGYKAGGVFPSPTGPLGGNTYKPERLYAYTAGLKNRFLDGTLQLNFEGFYWRYKDKQETFTGTNGLGIIDNITKNAPRSDIYGVDVDAVWRVTPHDTLRGTAEYLHAEYKDFSYTTVAPAVGCPTTGGPVFTVDCDGKEMARSPRWSGGAGYDHVFAFGSAGALTFTGDMKFSAARWLAVYYNPQVRAPGYAKFDVLLTYQPEGKRFSVTGYVRNIGKKVIATGAYSSLKGPNIYWVPLEPPRTYGVQARVNF